MMPAGGGNPLLIFDSGVGGLTVLAEIRRAIPGASLVYVADNAGFPYGAWEEAALTGHVVELFEGLIGRFSPRLCVIACNTASTLVLARLRARFVVPFVGTVPAIKPAAERTTTGLVSVLATPATVERDYTRGLIGKYAYQCRVTLVGAERLAALAEAKLAGAPVDRAVLSAEIAPAFVEEQGKRTDTVVLACTHYPLLMDELQAAAPWPVAWLNPADAIARRAAELWPADAAPAAGPGPDLALFTAPERVSAALRAALATYGLREIAPAPAKD
ncbi:MAG: glutamate racemase [Hyphomicrobiales bacterium]|nr:glutamate racemase [Hyphomicrobiales bacterium]